MKKLEQQLVRLHSRLVAIIIFCLVAFVAIGVRAQSISEVDLGSAREPSIAIIPDGTGNNIIAAWCDFSSDVYCSLSTDAGNTWNGSESCPGPGFSATLADEKLAVRKDGSGNPEALLAYNADGIYVDYSLDIDYTLDVIDWQDYSDVIQVDHGDERKRPSLAADNNYSNISDTHIDNAYLTWTVTGDGTSDVKVATILSGTHSILSGNPITIAASGTSGGLTYSVDACDIAIDADGNVFVLWRKTYSNNTRDLLLSESTDGGSDWTSSVATVVQGSLTPTGEFLHYEDYPCLAISKDDECTGGGQVFVAYTQGTTDETNPSDIWVVSSPISLLSGWNPEVINADNVVQPSDLNSNPYRFQFQPQMCPDGLGGVFIVYYSQQVAGTPTPPIAEIFESNPHAMDQPLTTSPSAPDGSDYYDYVGIVWDPVQKLVHPLWTDYPGISGMGIFTESISNAPLEGFGQSPDIGNLGYSCKRSIAMTGATAHSVALQGSAVEYSSQISSWPSSTDWLSPLQLDDGSSTSIASTAIAGYVKDASADQTAVAVAWGDLESDNVSVRVKEDPCGDWSPIFIIPNTSCACTANITPLTTPVDPTGPSIDRYLLGWIITWEDPITKGIYSVTLLRGGQSTGQYLVNDDWGQSGTYTHYTVTSQSTVLSNVLPTGFQSSLSVTSNENNSTFNGLSDHSSEIVYSSDGGTGGCKTLNAQYYTSGTALGNWETNTTKSQFILAPNASGQFDNNPSVTVTSSGQNIAVWEHIGPGSGGKGIHAKFLSSIHLGNNLQSGDWSVLQDFITAGADDPTFHWLVNPSVTAFPKTTLTGSADPHGTELLFTEYDNWGYGLGPEPVNFLHERLFDWGYTTPWVGGWTQGDQSPFPFSGVNSQRSFGLYTTGPHYTGTGELVDEDNTTPYTYGLTYGIGNADRGSYQFSTATIGAFKGTFAHPIGEDLYRVEDRYIDTSAVEFQWGGVYVEDTALGLPAREVILLSGQPDSGIFVSHAAIRDSIFATEWFNWPVSAKITYNRWMGISTGSFTDSVVDSSSCDTSTENYTTVPVYHSSPSVRGDVDFAQPGITMQYTVQLIHQSGLIDTVDQMLYNPFAGQEITPQTVHIVNTNDAADTVMLRVIGNFTGVPDADSNVVFGLEEMLDTIGDLGDTTIALGSGGFVPDTGCFEAIGPYPDPSEASGDNVSVLVHYCMVGSMITAQVYNIIGGPVGSPVTITSDGQTWDRMDILAPASAGAYYIQVSVGAFSSTLGYSVY